MALDAIEFNPSQSIEDLARLTGLSNSRLSHLFKELTGCSLKRYLSDRQLSEAAKLLSSTQLQIKQVSFQIGFSHEPSFVRAFRNKFGSSPSEYRNRQRLTLIDS
jgi:AraC family transcriptional regulator of arabinose operon